jgi:methionyl aminopeptidase
MAIKLKTPTQIEKIAEGGKKLSAVLGELVEFAEPGINLLEIEKKANQLIKEAGGEAGFKRVQGYDWATCLNVNKGIVHGIPKDYDLQNNDLLSIDIGMYYQDLNTDMCASFRVNNGKEDNGQKAAEIDAFLKTGRKTLEKAKQQVRLGNRIGHISQAIQENIEAAGYNCARNLTGHGIGEKVHEDPNIPCILKREIEKTSELKNGIVIAVEVIYTEGSPQLSLTKDGWTIEAADGKITAVFEETMALTEEGLVILTPLPKLGLLS